MDNNTTVILELDRPRELRCGHKALKQFSAMTGCSMVGVQDEVQYYDKLTLLLYCMLHADDPTVTPEQLDDWLDKLPKLKPAIVAVADAVKAAFDDDDDAPGDGVETPPEAAGTGEKA